MALIGNLVILREERAEDMPILLALRNDLETQGWGKSLPPAYTMPMYQKRFEEVEFSYSPKMARFIIEHKESGETAGTITYANLQPRHNAMMGIVVAKKFWGTGVAHEANELLLKFLFEELGLRAVHLYTHSGNPAAVRSAEKLGFRVSIRQRESIFKGGKRYDNLTLDILREEYYAQHPELTDNLPKLG